MAFSLDRWIGKVAIVTGASSGIGAAIAEHLTERGLQVVALARRKELLNDLAKKLSNEKGKLYPFEADISREEDILNAFKWVKENLGPVHILINNAGVIRATHDLIDGVTEDWKYVFQINVVGLCIATREAIRNMKENNVDGHIIHINSIGGHKVGKLPKGNVYPASKHAVTALTETLRLELNASKSKIKITSLSPGLVATEMVSPELRKFFGEYTVIEPEQIADSVVYVLSTPPHVQIQELIIRPIFDVI